MPIREIHHWADMVSHWLGAAWEAEVNMKLLRAGDCQLTVLLAAEPQILS